jgi:hypothetical protein
MIIEHLFGITDIRSENIPIYGGQTAIPLSFGVPRRTSTEVTKQQWHCHTAFTSINDIIKKDNVLLKHEKGCKC